MVDLDVSGSEVRDGALCGREGVPGGSLGRRDARDDGGLEIADGDGAAFHHGDFIVRVDD